MDCRVKPGNDTIAQDEARLSGRYSNQIATRSARGGALLAERLDDVAADVPSVQFVSRPI
jgi:hypothetical protein